MKKSYNRKTIRRLRYMKNKFKNANNIKDNPILYTVYINDAGTFETGLTVIEPGNANGEFFMTKGHKHKKNIPEIYILEKGEGKLLLQNKKIKIIKLKKNQPIVISGKTGHRLINTGNKKLEVLTIYSKKSGHDYNVEFKKRVFK